MVIHTAKIGMKLFSSKLLAIALTMAAAVLGCELAFQLHRADQSRQDLAALIAQLDSLRKQPTQEPTTDYVSDLPAEFQQREVLASLTQASQQTGAAVISTSMTSQPGTPSALGRNILNVTLRGRYPAIKSLMAQVLSSQPQALTQSLAIKSAADNSLAAGSASMAGPTEVEAQWTVIWPSPQAAAAAP